MFKFINSLFQNKKIDPDNFKKNYQENVSSTVTNIIENLKENHN